MISAELLAALISKIGIPELVKWLATRGKDDPITDAEILVKLKMTTEQGIQTGKAWLMAHPKEAGKSDS